MAEVFFFFPFSVLTNAWLYRTRGSMALQLVQAFSTHALCICARTAMAQGGKPIGLIVWTGVRLSLICARGHARDPEERDNTRGCVMARDLPVFFFFIHTCVLFQSINSTCHNPDGQQRNQSAGVQRE